MMVVLETIDGKVKGCDRVTQLVRSQPAIPHPNGN